VEEEEERRKQKIGNERPDEAERLSDFNKKYTPKCECQSN
jgi:hypothetical protein